MQQSIEFDATTTPAGSVPDAVSVPVPVRVPAATPSDPVALDPSRLDVYAVALDFHSRVSDGRVARSLLVRIVQMLTRLGARMRADASA